jgi:PDZ domain
MSNSERQILGGKPEAKDFEGIALLRQIFPDLSITELHKLHTDRLRKSCENRQKMAVTGQSQPTSLLGQKIWKSWLLTRSSNDLFGEELSSIGWQPVELPHGFLQLPSSVAVRRFNEKNGKWYYLLVKNLESQVIEQHMAHQDFTGLPVLLSGSSNIYSRVIYRDDNVGIGMTLCEKAGRVWVHSVTGKDGNRWYEPPPQIEEGGPAMKAGILPGHWLLGINGQALMSVSSAHTLLLSDAVSAIQYSSDPVILHFHKGYVGVQDSSQDHVSPNIFAERPSLLDLSLEPNEVNQGEAKTSVKHRHSRTPRIHPFVLELQRKGLVKNVSGKCSKLDM